MSQQEGEEEHAQELSAGGAGRSSTPDARGAEEDLSPSLKAIEAELASLSPRTDRLDRERLIFLAGQQSVLARAGRKGTVPFSLRENRDSPRARWSWPAAFSAMTAVAAALLVMLLSQPEPSVEVRIVEVPVEAPGSDDLAADETLPTAPRDGRDVEPLPDWQEPLPKPAPRSGLLALVGLDWLSLTDRGQLGPAGSYPRLLDQMLEGGTDDWEAPTYMVGPEDAYAPVPYRELLNSLLGNPEPAKSPPHRPLMHTLFYPGANS